MKLYFKDVHKQIQKRLNSLVKLRDQIQWACHDLSVLLEIIEDQEKEIWMLRKDRENLLGRRKKSTTQ